MLREKIVEKLTEIFQEIFNDDELIITDELTANDVEAWDSLTHIDMISMVEDEFEIQLTTKEIVKLENVGELITVIGNKL